jgi:hypothetical protein
LVQKLWRAITIARDEGLDSLAQSTRLFLTRAIDRTRRGGPFSELWSTLRYHGPRADPYRLVEIRPADVVSLTVPHFKRDLPVEDTHVVDGDWDLTVPERTLNFFGPWECEDEKRRGLPLENYLFYTSVEDHVRRGTPWRETAFYDWLTETDELPDESLYAHETGRQARFDQLDRLAAAMRTRGYRTQRQCAGDPTTPAEGTDLKRSVREVSADGQPLDGVPPATHEVLVNVGRDGQLFFEEGRHRFSVARALGIESIPVRVFVRHAAWQEKRSRVARATRASELPRELRQLLPHPDMTDVAADLSS